MRRLKACAILLLWFSLFGWSQNVPRVVNDADVVQLRGNVHPMARPQFDRGPSDVALPMERMILVLGLRAGGQQELEALIAQQHDPDSPLYHQWLTPEEFGARFGMSDDDLNAVQQWLTNHGFVIDEVAKSRTWVNFTGSVTQVEQAFHTQIHDYMVDGELHHANSVAPSIPQGLADIVLGVVSLHDFRKQPQHSAPQQVAPQYTSGSSHYLAPADFATLYDVNSLYSASVNGTGQTIAIVGRTDILLSDVQTFRTNFGLPANDPVFVHNGVAPGDLGGGEETEADLDVEWSGAAAPNATVKFVISKSTTTDGVDLSAQYIVNNNLAPVMSTSFGQGETCMTAAENSFYNTLYSQAASQGITAFISSGDSGPAGCDSGSATKATGGLTVNGLCSTPFDVCVGGTQFNDTANPSLYWSATNDPTTRKSVLGVIPEMAWNESGTVSGGSGLWSSGGGVSSIYAKPSWQTGTGVPADGKRDVPDVSLTAAGHDGYLIYQGGGLFSVGGTSAASPSFAGLMALVVQKTGARQGNANTVFYLMAGTSAFRDITSGNNIVPKSPTGTFGYSTTTGYDLVTGLGSVDAANLVNNWGGAPVPTAAAMTSPTPGSTLPGSTVTFTWNTGVGVGQYMLWIGTEVGGNELYYNPLGTATTVTVNNLFGSGTLYVRLLSNINGAWQYRDYTYQPGAAPTAAAMTSPTPGSTLPGSTVTFTWNTGVGVGQYMLWIGTEVGGNELYYNPLGTATTVTVNNLFGSGTLYVRLLSNINGAWQYRDYTYQPGAAPTAAAMTSPTPGSTLPGSTVTFTWNTGVGVGQYMLWIGTEVGGNELYYNPLGTATTVTVNNLFGSGTLYVRLLSNINGAWQYRDYTYQPGAAPTAAAMTSPTPGSTLPGSTVTFTWNTGVGVGQYMLWIGTEVGGNELYYNPLGSATSAVVSLNYHGTIYVRLLSYINGGWHYNDYTYLAP